MYILSLKRFDYLFAFKHFPFIYAVLQSSSFFIFPRHEKVNTNHQSRIKESLYITWLMPILNKQKQYQFTSLSF